MKAAIVGLIFFSSFGVYQNAFARFTSIAVQDSVPRLTLVSKATIKLNLPCLIDPFRQSIFFASDLQIATKTSIDFGLGWFFHDWGSGDYRYKEETFNGIRARLGIKYYYLDHKTKPRRIASPYIGIEAKYNRIVDRNFENICRYGCQYEETMLMTENRTVYGISFKYGLHFFFGKDRRFFFDAYTGLGYRYLRIEENAIPLDAERFTTGNPFQAGPGQYDTPDFLLGFYLGYRIK